MLVVMVAVGCVTVAVMDVVHVIAMRYRHVAAVVAVHVRMVGVLGVAGGVALVIVTVVCTVQVPVMGIVDVVAVRYGHVAAFGAVRVLVIGVFDVCRGHSWLLVSSSRPYRASVSGNYTLTLPSAHQCTIAVLMLLDLIKEPPQPRCLGFVEDGIRRARFHDYRLSQDHAIPLTGSGFTSSRHAIAAFS